MDMILTGRPVGAKEALSMGLANRIVKDGTRADEDMFIFFKIQSAQQLEHFLRNLLQIFSSTEKRGLKIPYIHHIILELSAFTAISTNNHACENTYNEIKCLPHFILLSIYSLGLGIPFFISSVAFNSFLGYFVRAKKYIRIVTVVSGAFLCLVGALIYLNYLSIFAAWFNAIIPFTGS
jgi:hypothetical protein